MSGAFADLARDTAVSQLPSAPGWYVADLPERWNYFTPSGGVLMTLALRAMQAEVGDEFRPLSANTLFMSPVPHGPLEIRVEVLRQGNVATQMRAALSSTTLPGPGLEVSATFVRNKTGPRFIDRAVPADVLSVADAPPYFDTSRLKSEFFKQLEIRLALGRRWWDPSWQHAEPGPARYARWWRYRVPQLRGEALDPLAIPPIADTMPASVVMKLGPEHPHMFMPSLDLTVHFLAQTTEQWLLGYATSRYGSDGYATGDIEIWDPSGNLVAFATQTMMLRNQPNRT